MQQIHTNAFLRLCVLVVTLALVGADVAGLAQNTNTSTPTDTSAQNDNTTNANPTRRTGARRRRGGTRRVRTGDANANTGDTTGDNTNMTGDSTTSGDNANMTGDTSMQDTNANTGATGATTGRRRRRGRRRAAAATPTDTTGAEQTGTPASGAGGLTSGVLGRVGDPASLDGTYTGTVNYPDGGMTGEGTLTITGSTFTLESGGNTQTGTLTSQTFPGYTAVSMRFGTETPAKIVSVRAWHHANSLRLQSVPGESHAFSFRSGGGGGGATTGGRRRRGRRRAAPPPPPAEEPATPPPSV